PPRTGAARPRVPRSPPRVGGGGIREARAWSDRTEARLLGVLVAVSGAVAVVSALVPAHQRRLAELESDLGPLAPPVHRAAHAATALAGLALLLVARGLVRRRALSWWVTLALLGVLGIAHLAKAVDVTAITVTASVVVLLLQGRRLYRG